MHIPHHHIERTVTHELNYSRGVNVQGCQTGPKSVSEIMEADVAGELCSSQRAAERPFHVFNGFFPTKNIRAVF